MLEKAACGQENPDYDVNARNVTCKDCLRKAKQATSHSIQQEGV